MSFLGPLGLHVSSRPGWSGRERTQLLWIRWGRSARGVWGRGCRGRLRVRIAGEGTKVEVIEVRIAGRCRYAVWDEGDGGAYRYGLRVTGLAPLAPPLPEGWTNWGLPLGKAELASLDHAYKLLYRRFGLSHRSSLSSPSSRHALISMYGYIKVLWPKFEKRRFYAWSFRTTDHFPCASRNARNASSTSALRL